MTSNLYCCTPAGAQEVNASVNATSASAAFARKVPVVAGVAFARNNPAGGFALQRHDMTPVRFTGTKVNGARAKIRQRIISHEKSEVLVSLPLFGIPGAYLCTINKNNQHG